MRDATSWSVNCGFWGGVRVYLHASLLVVFVTMVYLIAQVSAPGDLAFNCLVCISILLASVFLHDLAHALAAWRMGGSTDLIVLGPFGGMHWPNVPREPHREVVVALAGIAAHLLVVAFLVPPLLLSGVNVADPLVHPFYPHSILLASSAGIVIAKVTLWFNWLLLLVNLVPADPLDGGRVLRSVLWPAMGYRGAIRTVARSGMLVALVLCLLALVLHNLQDSRLVPTWFPLVLLSIYLYFSSRQELQRVDDEDQDDDLFGYDFSQGYTSLERSNSVRRRNTPGPLRRWLRQRREIKQRKLLEIEAEEERRFDEVLIQLKEAGMESLSPDDQALMRRVSARYRKRLQS